MTKLIGEDVQTTDPWDSAGYDFLPLMHNGMLKVDKSAVDVNADKVIKSTDAAPLNPDQLSWALDLPPAGRFHVGDPITLSVKAQGGTPPYTYDWFKGTADLNKNDPVAIIAANAATGHAAIYKATATDADGNVITSQGMNITVVQKTVTGKGDITGKKQGEVIPINNLFAFSGDAALSDIASVTGTDVTWDGVAGTLTVADTAVVGNDIVVAFTTKQYVTKAGTITLKAIVAK